MLTQYEQPGQTRVPFCSPFMSKADSFVEKPRFYDPKVPTSPPTKFNGISFIALGINTRSLLRSFLQGRGPQGL